MPGGTPDQSKLKPLSLHALGVLRQIAEKPVPVQEINAGVVDRFDREKLCRRVMVKSPYAIHKGKEIPHLEASDAGIAKIKASPKFLVVK